MPTSAKKSAKTPAPKTPAKALKPKPKTPVKTIVKAAPKPPPAEKPDTRLVVQSNALIRAAHGLSLSEKRLIALATTKIDSFNPPLPGASLTVKIIGLEYAKAFKIDRTTAYEQLEQSAKSLYQRSITFQEPTSPRSKKSGAIVRMRWVGKAKYHAGEGWVELGFWHEVVPHLTGLRAEFTKYRLDQTSALKSVNSWRLMELLERFNKTGWAEYTITELCAALEATDAQRKDYGKIRTQLLEPAINELTGKAGWDIAKPTMIKTNRRVTSVRFDFTPPK